MVYPDKQLLTVVVLKEDAARSQRSASSSEDDEPITPRKGGRRRTAFMGIHELGNVGGISTPLDQERRKKDESIRQRRSTPLHPTIELDGSDESEESDIFSPLKGSIKAHRSSTQATPKSPITVSSEEESEPVPIGSTRRGLRKPQSIPQTPRKSRRRRSSGPRFMQVSVPINRLPSNTATTPTHFSKRADARRHQVVQSKKREGHSSAPLRCQAGPESDDSSDSLMNELRASLSEPERSPSDPLESGDESGEHSVRSSRRMRKLPCIENPSLVELSDSEAGHQTHNNRPNGNKKREGLSRATRPETKKTTRQKQLELLRKRRAGEAVGLLSDRDSLEADEQDMKSDVDPGEAEPEDEDSGTERVRRAIQSNLDEYEEDFVVDDDDTVGAPADFANIPIEFTRHAHKKPIEHFKDVVEWMVHNKLNPAFARHDPVYTIAVRKLDDAVQAYAGSKFMSSAWKPAFLEALKRHPDCARVDVSAWDQNCEACGRSGHTAKHQLIFSGKPYHRGTLEDVSSDEEHSDEPQSGSQLPQSDTKAFFLGRTCNANAETAHALYHWRHQLNQFVLIYLRSEGHFTPEKILERSNWNTKRREKYANAVVDQMEADGQMKDLYREFKQNLEAARETKNDGNYHYGRKG